MVLGGWGEGEARLQQPEVPLPWRPSGSKVKGLSRAWDLGFGPA